MAEINGFCDERFAEMKSILSANLDSGADIGASVAVTIDGALVVDMWGGWVDGEKSAPWTEHTLTNVWSSTKTMMTLSVLLCVERGLVDVDAPVAKYWPEFAANGKDGVLVRHLMSHTSGVSGWAQPVAVSDIYDWDKSTAALAAQAPWWEPGTMSGYHALNQGHLVGEVVRRVTGRKLGQFFADELAKPLGLDFHIGISPSQFSRISNVIAPPPLPIDFAALDPESVMVKTFTGPQPDATESWKPEWRQADIGAANGQGNARAIARGQALLACEGELDGTRFLSKEVCQIPLREQSNGPDLVLGVPLKFGIGYAIPNETVPHLPQTGRISFWGGWGGSTVVVDQDRHMTISYVMNRMEAGLIGDSRGESLSAAAFAAVG
jgi:CubicO group peptidase (beta-lactamase class C family)